MRFVMVELRQAAQRGEGGLDVAGFAVVAEVGIVRIVVATVAILKRHPCKLLENHPVARFFFVALDAPHGFVLAQQGKIGLIVVKIPGRRKRIGSMAPGAIVGERTLVGILVAGFTFLCEAQKGIASFFQTGVVDEIGFMAFPAISRRMRAFQFIAGKRMVKFLLVKMDHLEIPAVVVAMTGGAVFAFGLARGVKTVAAVEPGFDLFMARQAFIVGDFIAQIVAFGTVENTLQVGVRLRQIAGRQLRHGLQ